MVKIQMAVNKIKQKNQKKAENKKQKEFVSLWPEKEERTIKIKKIKQDDKFR